ncbi:ADP-ribosylation factor-like protein 4C [Apostichopus japonicus]|uniref:ADP-ribosylation factor-like protein 4C n=1 Tax=Stichopus japonicus TaxID=307972 RepID=UPI003AB59980
MMKGGILRTVSDLGNEISYQARGFLPSNTHQIAVIGLDKSGKTTFLYRLHLNEFIHTVPTIGFNSEKIKSTSGKSKGQSFQFWDAGGQEKLRPLWKSYTRASDAIIYVVDSTDHDRLEESKCELYKVARTEENKDIPILVVANKQDLREAMPVAKLEENLGIGGVRGHRHRCDVIGVCAITGEGMEAVLDVLHEMAQKRKKLAKQQKKKGR